MSQQPVYYCLVCQGPSYYPEPVVDFGEAGLYPIRVCEECLCRGETNTVVVAAIRELISFIPPKAVEARMKDVLGEYRQEQQGS